MQGMALTLALKDNVKKNVLIQNWYNCVLFSPMYVYTVPQKHPSYECTLSFAFNLELTNWLLYNQVCCYRQYCFFATIWLLLVASYD